MSKVPLHFKSSEFYNEFGTSCYINKEKMIDSFPLYRHDFIEISLILSGTGTETVNGQKFPIQKGSLSVLMPWHFHTIHTKYDEPITRFICEFSMEDFLAFSTIWEDAKKVIFDKDLAYVIQLDGDEFDEVCTIFNHMYDLFNMDVPYKQVSLYLKLIEFMILYYRVQKERALLVKDTTKPIDHVIHDAIRYIHQHFSEDITVLSTSKELGISSSSLPELLKGYTGQDFQAFLTDIRIRNACILLGLKTPTIKYIAQNTGFNSLQSFYRVFKSAKGMTPEQFRNAHWMESEGKAGFLMYNNEIWKIVYYIHHHFDQDITPESVSSDFGISTSYLHKIIKYNLMQSFSELLREVRISYACGVLSNLDLSISQVAVEVGYNNTKTFTRSFVKQQGCTPTEYRIEYFKKG